MNEGEGKRMEKEQEIMSENEGIKKKMNELEE
jgi:hypothetical protein